MTAIELNNLMGIYYVSQPKFRTICLYLLNDKSCNVKIEQELSTDEKWNILPFATNYGTNTVESFGSLLRLASALFEDIDNFWNRPLRWLVSQGFSCDEASFKIGGLVRPKTPDSANYIDEIFAQLAKWQAYSQTPPTALLVGRDAYKAICDYCKFKERPIKEFLGIKIIYVAGVFKYWSLIGDDSTITGFEIESKITADSLSYTIEPTVKDFFKSTGNECDD